MNTKVLKHCWKKEASWLAAFGCNSSGPTISLCSFNKPDSGKKPGRSNQKQVQNKLSILYAKCSVLASLRRSVLVASSVCPDFVDSVAKASYHIFILYVKLHFKAYFLLEKCWKSLNKKLVSKCHNMSAGDKNWITVELVW